MVHRSKCARTTRKLLKFLVCGGLAHFTGFAEKASVQDSISIATNSYDEVHTALSVRVENDVFAGTDRDYSNGISLSLLARGRGFLGNLWNLFGETDRDYYQSYEVGQVIVTPMDTRLTVPDPADRPYAGLLYVDIGTAMRQGNLFHGLKVVTGVVGPYSLAEETQNWFHGIIGSGHAMGWSYQLHNEPIFNLVYEHRRKYQLFQSNTGFGSDIIPAASAMLGNVLIQAQAGAQLRLGYHLPNDFGTTLLRGFGAMPFPQYSNQSTAATSFRNR
jgi:lipid A 3-O-deacylase